LKKTVLCHEQLRATQSEAADEPHLKEMSEMRNKQPQLNVNGSQFSYNA
jgi:hypothetical protein